MKASFEVRLCEHDKKNIRLDTFYKKNLVQNKINNTISTKHLCIYKTNKCSRRCHMDHKLNFRMFAKTTLHQTLSECKHDYIEFVSSHSRPTTAQIC